MIVGPRPSQTDVLQSLAEATPTAQNAAGAAGVLMLDRAQSIDVIRSATYLNGRIIRPSNTKFDSAPK